MESFGHFAAAFNDWKTQNNIEINFNDSRGYFWRIGDPAKDYWQPDYETKVPNAKSAEIAAFRAMFIEGNEMLGIPTGKSLGSFQGAKLYRMSTYPKSYTVSNLLFAYNGTMLDGSVGNTVTDPNTGEVFSKPIIIKPETLSMTGGFDGVDVIASKISGLIYGAGYKNQQRTSNRLGQESIMGTLDYRTGAITLLRSNTNNDALAPDYQAFIQGLTIAPVGETGETGTGGGLTFTGTVPPPSGALSTINLNCSYQVFDNPVTLVWEFQL